VVFLIAFLPVTKLNLDHNKGTRIDQEKEEPAKTVDEVDLVDRVDEVDGREERA